MPAPEPASPLRKIRPDALVVAAASINPISIEPESPMKIRAGLKLCGRKPRQAPASTAAMQRRRVGRRVVADPLHQPDREQAGRGGRDQADAGGQPVEAVDEVHRVDQRHREQHGEQHALLLAEDERTSPTRRPSPPHGTQKTTHCTPNSTSTPAAVICPASLVSASSS